MQEEGYNDLTLEQIVNKMKKMQQKYKTRKTGNSKKRSRNILTKLTILCLRNNVTPVP